MSRSTPIRVLIVDDTPEQREGYRMLLASQPDFEVIGQAGDGAQALGILRRSVADVVLMDVQMPRVNGLVAADRITGDATVRSLAPAPRIVLMTAVDLDDYVPAAAAAGGYAIVYKDLEPETLFAVIREAAVARADD